MGDEARFAVFPVIDNGAIGVGEFEQIHVARTERERRRFVESAANAHPMGGFGDSFHAHFLSEPHCHGVDALRESTAQRHRVACEIAVGIAGRPRHLFFLLFVPNFHRNIFVATLVAGRQSLIHRLGIDEEFKRRAGLSHCRHFVVFPRVEIDVANPRLHVARVWFHRHKRTVHEANHVANRVHR